MSCFDVQIVSGYVRLDSDHRSHNEYLKLCSKLQNIGLPMSFFVQNLNDCWLYRHYQNQGVAIEESGNKDSMAYKIIMHEKSNWMHRASKAWSPKTLVWIDAGIFHLQAILPKHIIAFVEHLKKYPPQRILSPSCKPLDMEWDDRVIDWTFCGGVLAMPALMSHWFQRQVEEHAKKDLTWEVNTWSKIVRKYPDNFQFYSADHNERMFTGIKS